MLKVFSRQKRSGGRGNVATVLRLALLFASLFCCAGVEAGLKIYYVRHGETMGNVKRGGEMDDSGQPVDSQTFTELGNEQVRLLTKRLEALPLDFIATSPRERAMNTVRPYLQATGKKAEIWPELTEITTGGEPVVAEWPDPSPDLFTGGGALRVKRGDRNTFLLREEGSRAVKLGKEPVQKEADKRAVAAKLARLAMDRFGGSDQSILLVGHGGNGRRFLTEMLTRNADADTAREIERLITKIRLHNGGTFLLEEQADGRFALAMINDGCDCEYCRNVGALIKK